MSWIWIVLIVIAGLLALVVVVGNLLPARFRAVVTADLPAAPAAAWEAIAAYEVVPMCGNMARGVTRLPDQNGLPCWEEDLGSSKITIRTIAHDPPGQVVRELEDSVVPMTARWTATVSAAPAGSRVEIVQEGEIARGTWHVPFFRFMVHVAGAIKMGMRGYVRALARHLRDAYDQEPSPTR